MSDGGRYVFHKRIAAGGMGTVHFAVQRGALGFARVVAIKRLHPQFAEDEDARAAFADEARLAARIEHPNVVRVVDVVDQEGELLVVMEYVLGASLAELVKAGPLPENIAAGIALQVLRGLDAAHRATLPSGEPLELIHRDVSPQNIMVGRDGLCRLLDFGVARAAGRAQITIDGGMKGKLGYMAPEQLRGESLDVTADLYALAVVLWEALTGRRLFPSIDGSPFVALQLRTQVPTLASIDVPVSAALDQALTRALAITREPRFSSARAFSEALEAVAAKEGDIAAFVRERARAAVEERASYLSTLERGEPAPAPESASPEPVEASSVSHSGTLDLPEVSVFGGRAEFRVERTELMPTTATAARLVVRPRANRAPYVVGGLLAALLVVLLVLRGDATSSGSAARGSVRPREEMVRDPAAAPRTRATDAEESPTARPALRALPSAQPSSPRAPRPACDPPYTLDDRGVKHFKEECM
jgi:eukaryotic-like serine/threonine-protein kinase